MLTASAFDATASVSESPGFLPSMPAATASPSAQPLPAPRDDTALTDVLRHPGIWRRGSKSSAAIGDAPSTGLAELDALLPGGGWPRGALSEILIGQDGIGECSLLLPVLAALTRARQRVVLVGAPYIPYAPALAEAGVDLAQLVHIEAAATDTHWTAEQCLRAGCCGAVVNWLPQADYRQLRRLQLAAETGAALAFVFRPLAAAREASPAALRLMVTAATEGPRIEILKCRGTLVGSQAMRQRA